jgi:hypothetical protein
VRCDGSAIAQWRKQPVWAGGQKIPASFLKHAEDQTVLALMTVLQAIELHGYYDYSFADWGVIAAPNLFGRITMAQTIQRYQEEGAWGVSPHLIPHQSLHAMSGTISQALKIYGPNFGVGGGPNDGSETFLVAAAMLTDHQLPGLWVVLTGYESEWIPSPDGRPTPAPICQCVALALIRGDAKAAGLHLSVGQSRLGLHAHSQTLVGHEDPGLAHLSELHLGLLAEELSISEPRPTGSGPTTPKRCRWRLADGHWLELEAGIRGPEGRL